MLEELKKIGIYFVSYVAVSGIENSVMDQLA